ncbi:MAG: ribosome maturation factor RimP [Acidobacteria bacterium]|nr:ribosome maturation factor RimP [Acidobacteriota bacterium]
MKLDPGLQEIVDKVVAREGLELVHAELSGGHSPLLRVLIDKPGGVTLDDCARISEKLGLTLDVEDVIPHRYTLEVASPGLDRGLYREADYDRFAGLRSHVRTTEPIAGQRNFHGRLVGLDRDGEVAAVVEEPTGQRHVIPLALISKAWVEIEPQPVHNADLDQ